MQFKDVIGQKRAKSALLSYLQSDRVPHALLLAGPQGSGKLALAFAYAQYILCESPASYDACGDCANCKRVQKLLHPDLHFSFPTVGAKALSNNFLPEWRKMLELSAYFSVNDWLQQIGAENKQGNITKEECVQIVKKLSLKAFMGDHKILIIWLPEYLGKEGNRLLKLIEEPPEKTLFILVAERLELILNTIISRCQVVQLTPLAEEDIANDLINKHAIDTAKANRLAQLSSGDYSEAIRLMKEIENDHAKQFLQWMRLIYKGNGVELVNWVEEFAKVGRENQKHFLRYALHFFRELLALKGNINELKLGDKETSTALKMEKVINPGQLIFLTNLLNESVYFVERNANPKILFLDVSVQAHKIISGQPSTVNG